MTEVITTKLCQKEIHARYEAFRQGIFESLYGTESQKTAHKDEAHCFWLDIERSCGEA